MSGQELVARCSSTNGEVTHHICIINALYMPYICLIYAGALTWRDLVCTERVIGHDATREAIRELCTKYSQACMRIAKELYNVDERGPAVKSVWFPQGQNRTFGIQIETLKDTKSSDPRYKNAWLEICARRGKPRRYYYSINNDRIFFYLIYLFFHLRSLQVPPLPLGWTRAEQRVSGPATNEKR